MKLSIQIAVVLTLGTALAGVGWRMRELQDQVSTLQSASGGGRSSGSAAPSRSTSEKNGAGTVSAEDMSGRVDRIEDAIRHLTEKTLASGAVLPPAKELTSDADESEDAGEEGSEPARLSPEALALLQDPKMKQALSEAVQAVLEEQRRKEQEQRNEERKKRALDQLSKALELTPVQVDAVGKAIDTFRGSLQAITQNKDLAAEVRKTESQKVFQALDQQIAYSLTANQQATYAEWKKKSPWLIRSVGGGGDEGGGGGKGPRKRGGKEEAGTANP